MKKAAVLLMSLVLTLMLSGCGDVAPSPTPSPSPTAMPVLTPSPSPSPTPIPINVDFVATIDTSNSTPTVRIQTNLPDGFVLSIRIYRYFDGGYYLAQDGGNVWNGIYESKVFTDKGHPLPAGTYTLEIDSPRPKEQSQAVLDIIGRNGEAMNGATVKYSDIFDGKMIEYQKTFTIK